MNTVQRKPREILFLIGSLYRGGTETHLLALAPQLLLKGWSVKVYCFSRRGELSEALEAAGVEVISAPIELKPSMPRPLRLLLLVLSLIKFLCLLLFRRPYAVHIFLPAAYWLGAPLLLLTRTQRRLVSRRSRNHYLEDKPLAGRWERFLHRHMTILLGNSKKVITDLLEEGAPSDRVRLIYNGVDTARLQDRSLVRKRIRANLSVGEALVMCSVANLIPYKGHADLIDALILAQPRLPLDWFLLIVGRDDGIGSLLQYRAEEGGIAHHIKFLGSREDVQELLAASDIFILPSHEEGFSNALIEAMAMGLPAIATDVGGNAEAIEDGVSGMIVPPQAPSQLAEAIQTLSADVPLRVQMGAAALDRVRKHFSIGSCVNAYDALYKSLE